MPDISMCSNTSCVKRKECYRFTATPNQYRQAYSQFANSEENPCKWYWPDVMISSRTKQEQQDETSI